MHTEPDKDLVKAGLCLGALEVDREVNKTHRRLSEGFALGCIVGNHF